MHLVCLRCLSVCVYTHMPEPQICFHDLIHLILQRHEKERECVSLHKQCLSVCLCI